MKKLCALLLSVIMAASLTVPAFAAPAPVDGDPGFFVDGEPAPVYTPGDAIPINAFLPEATDDTALGIIGGADGPTAIITSGFDQGDWYPAPDITWAELEKEIQKIHQQFIDQEKAALGGVPGQIGVMVNGAYIKFPDAAPEIANGRTMVPVRALVEALGGEVEYNDGTIRIFVDEYGILLTVGSTEAMAYVRGTDTGEPNGVVDLDCAPYIKDGRTYVPIRFISKALGYEVGWDSDFQTAILLDRAALAADIDKDFTILNRVLGNLRLTVEEGKSRRTDLKGSVTVTAFDTLNGNQTYKADLTGNSLWNAEALNSSCSVTISDNAIDALMKQLIGGEGSEYEEDAAILRNTIRNLKNMEIIMNREGLAWIHAPVLDELGGEENLWCGMDLGASEAQAVFAGTGSTTVGTLMASFPGGSNSVMDWSTLAEMVDALAEVYGDKNFTTSGGVSTMTIDLDDLNEMDPDSVLGMQFGAYDYKEYKFTLKVDSKGGVTMTSDMETRAEYGMPAVRASLNWTRSGGKSSVTVTYHMANVGEMKLTLSSTQKAVNDKPMSEPPAGANVVDAPELLNP